MDTISNDKDFFKFLQNVCHDPWNVFRGVRSEKFKLIPKIGRHKVTKYGSEKFFNAKEEKLILDLFVQQASLYFNFKQMGQLERIVIAQHYGLPTRLLDWTYNPLVATFFAVMDDCIEDSAIYFTKIPERNKLNIKSNFDPFKIKIPRFYFPDHIDERIRYQKGLFTISPDPYEPIHLNGLQKIIIKNVYRRKLKYLLYTLGIHYSTIFPGIEGVAKHIYWVRTNIY